MLGEASGSDHNVARSTAMAAQLRSIGLSNTGSTRQFLTQALTNAARQPGGVLQDNGRVVKESLLMGPQGGAVLKTVWEGDKLITTDVIKQSLKLKPD